jgi:predicted DNA-binding transcriptional regulator AlpA
VPESPPTLDPILAALGEIRDALRAPSEPSLSLGLAEVIRFTGQSRSSIYRGISDQSFPAPVATPGGPKWRRSDLVRWSERLKPVKRRAKGEAVEE